MTDQEREFIESAARVMWAGAWAQHEEQTCVRCGDPIYGDEKSERRAMCDLETPCKGRTFVGGEELTDSAPPTPQYALLEAARLLGKLEQANGSGLAAIIHSASKVEDTEFCRTAHAEYGPRTAASFDNGHPQHEHDTPRNGRIWFDDEDIDVREFASDVALEALGTGVSWTDDHEAFEVPARPEHTCRAPSVPPTPFVVPSFEFEYEGEQS